MQDPQGAALRAEAELTSGDNQFRQTFQTDAHGHYVFQGLVFGVYRLEVHDKGFAPWSRLVAVRSETPLRMVVKLGLAPVNTEVAVSDSATLIDPAQTGTHYSIGQRQVGEAVAPQPGRTLSDLVDDLPGWLYEANGVLHPRGSEYGVQYVIDGLPVTENRSPAFAPPLDADVVSSMRVLTAGYPAEYGRKLGGVIEVTTVENVPSGLHGRLDLHGGSFATVDGSGGLSYFRGKDQLFVNGDGFHTERYLDPPVLENYTNRATAASYSASYQRELSGSDRLHLMFSRNVARFLVPNERVQQQAGQRQDATNIETDGMAAFQHIVSPNLLLNFAGSIRDAVATLSSNAESTPVIVAQNRGYREGYLRGDVAGHHGIHDWKAGIDAIANPVHEKLRYTITDPSQFDPDTQQQFQFSSHRWDVEPSAYVQDQIRLGYWNLSLGMRFDSYRFVVDESAWSPRAGVSRYFPSHNLLLHFSYDRTFETPAVENLLLASSPEVGSLNPIVVRLPVRPARANYYEGGAGKVLFGRVRVDANIFRRDFRNYADDDVLLDTGVSFPIAFAKARIIGEEVRIAVPQWGRFSGGASYSNQTGTGYGPITGGLFLGSDASDALNTDKFPVSQDQRNTAHAQVRLQATRWLWLSASGDYGSGLPAETDGEDQDFLLAQYGPEIVNQVNFSRGRVRPAFVLTSGAGVEIYHDKRYSARLQVQAANLANRVRVINFASLFSGTAVAPPRSASVGLRLTF